MSAADIVPFGAVAHGLPGVMIDRATMSLSLDPAVWRPKSQDDGPKVVADLAKIVDLAVELAEASPFFIGDLVVESEGCIPLLYTQAFNGAEQRLGTQTLRNYASVARNVKPAQRRPALTYSHHKAVSKLRPTEQERWLKKAEREGWTVKQFRAEINDTDTPGSTGEQLRELCRQMWISSQRGPAEAGPDEYVVRAEPFEAIARMLGHMPLREPILDEEDSFE